MDSIPFDQVYIHPKILDGFGETMSKSKGNGIDPLDVIEKFGADALRFGMAHLTTETQDVRLPVRFECPHCETPIEQTKKNRILPAVECKSCKKSFSTQWAESDEDKALPRGPVVSERFELARNFANKLWNASRFAMINLQDYSAGPIDESSLTLEDRWILSRLSTVTKKVTEYLEGFKYAEATRELYEFSWNEFCSFYVEMLKDRFADEEQKPTAQRMLAFTLDTLLRLMHPITPFITEEIWQNLAKICPKRGYSEAVDASPSLITASWPELPEAWQQPEIESQFSEFQTALGALREIRSAQNLPPKTEVEFLIRCEDQLAGLIRPMATNFESMAHATLTMIGPKAEAPKINATVTKPSMELFVDLAGHIDVDAERGRLNKELDKKRKSLAGIENKLANEKYVNNAPKKVVQESKEMATELKEQITKIEDSISELAAIT